MLGKIINNKIQIDQNRRRFQSSQEQKQGTGHDPCTQHHQGGAKHPGHLPGLNPGPSPTLISYADWLPHPLEPAREHVTCFCSLMSPNKAFFPLNLCLAFYQLLLIESRSLGRYHRRAFAEGQDAARRWCLQWASSRNRG